MYKNTFVFASGFYLSNPRETNHVHTVNFDKLSFTHGDKGLMFNSVPDQSLLRAGVTHAIWPAKGLAMSLSGRWEGIPAHDLIGGSDGYRQPGYSVSIEPGASLSHGRDFLEVTVPIAVYRYGLNSVPLERIHSPNVGKASFADYQINITYSHEF